MRELGTRTTLEEPDREMGDGAKPGRPDVDAAGRLLRQFDEGFEVGRVDARRVDDQRIGDATEGGDGRKIPHEVEAGPGIDGRRVDEAGVADKQGVAVWRGTRGNGRADGPAGAAAIVDHH